MPLLKHKHQHQRTHDCMAMRMRRFYAQAHTQA